MNCAQALGVAAAAFVVAGDPWLEPLRDARVELMALAAHGEALSVQALHAIALELAGRPDQHCARSGGVPA